MTARVLLKSDQAAADTLLDIGPFADIPATIFATGLAGVEKVTIELTPDNGVTTVAVLQGGESPDLTVTNTARTFTGQGKYKISKPGATANNVGVFLAFGSQL